MKITVHTTFVMFLVVLGALASIAVAVHGCSYYLTPMDQRPFHPQYDRLNPAGIEGEGYGVIGALMIIVGVIMYSSRKRIRALSDLGKIKYYLEFHIFLCLVGPILVFYHSTFKFGGIVAVSLWSMTAVVLSGVVGRYLYIQIPKGIQGNALTMEELQRQHETLGRRLVQEFGVDENVLHEIDRRSTPPKPPAEMSIGQIFTFFFLNDLFRKSFAHELLKNSRGGSAHAIRQLTHLVRQRAVLGRRIAFLEQLKQLFKYWHVVHLPFSLIMFAILFVHVGVALAFGYTWIW